MITDWDALPLVMHVEHMAALLGVERATIWKRCQRDRKALRENRPAIHMRPAPESYEPKELTWYRENVRAHFERRPAVQSHFGRHRKPVEHISDLRLAKEQLTRAVSA